MWLVLLRLPVESRLFADRHSRPPQDAGFPVSSHYLPHTLVQASPLDDHAFAAWSSRDLVLPEQNKVSSPEPSFTVFFIIFRPVAQSFRATAIPSTTGFQAWSTVIPRCRYSIHYRVPSLEHSHSGLSLFHPLPGSKPGTQSFPAVATPSIHCKPSPIHVQLFRSYTDPLLGSKSFSRHSHSEWPPGHPSFVKL